MQGMYNKLSWVSVPLQVLPHCLGNTFTLSTWWSIYFSGSGFISGGFTEKYPFPTSLPSDYDKCLSSLPPQPSVVCVWWTNSSCKWKDKFTITFLLFLPCSLSSAAHHFLVSSSLTWSHLHQPPCFIGRTQTMPLGGFAPAISSPQSLLPKIATKSLPLFFN